MDNSGFYNYFIRDKKNWVIGLNHCQDLNDGDWSEYIAIYGNGVETNSKRNADQST